MQAYWGKWWDSDGLGGGWGEEELTCMYFVCGRVDRVSYTMRYTRSADQDGEALGRRDGMDKKETGEKHARLETKKHL